MTRGARPWSRHRHWHDDRGRTHKQGDRIPILSPGELHTLEQITQGKLPTINGWPQLPDSVRAPTPSATQRTYPCDWCKEPVVAGTATCPYCGQDSLPF